jgi:hypothetical protein
MAVYPLTGAGLQPLSALARRLLVDVTTFGTGLSTGQATPINFFHIGMLRLGRGGYFYPPFPLDAQHQCIDLPTGVDTLGFTCLAGTAITVTEEF